MVKDVKVLETNLEGRETKILEIHLKAPKEQKISKGVKVELFPVPGTEFCPVKAFQKWNNLSKLKMNKSQVMFRKQSGKAYTGKEFNRDLKELLSPHIDYDKGKVLSHSFRSGLATTMAQLGKG